MVGCSGKVTYPNRATLCGAGGHVCSANDWLANRNNVAPTHDYWTNDPLRYGGYGSSQCFAGDNAVVWLNGQLQFLPSYACPDNEPMRICSGATDPEGNVCNWTGCGYEAFSNSYFGGCYANATAGTACCF